MNDSSPSAPTEPAIMQDADGSDTGGDNRGEAAVIKKHKDGRNIIIKIYTRNPSAVLAKKSRTVQDEAGATRPRR